MATSATLVQTPMKESYKVSCADVTIGTYASGGVTITPKQLGLSTVYFAIATLKSVSGTVNVTQAFYDASTSLIKIFDETPEEVAGASDLSGVIFRIVAYGA